MIRYFVVVAILGLVPLLVFLAWYSSLPTEAELLLRHQPQLQSKLEQLKQLRGLVPPPGSVTKNDLPQRLTPLPVIDFPDRRCNLQFIYAHELANLEQPRNPVQGSEGPFDYARVLEYTLRRGQQPNPGTPRVWGYQAIFQQGLETRYLLVNQPVTRQTPKGTETLAVEGFLFDLETNQLLGSFRYPQVGMPDQLRYLRDYWKTTIHPQVPIRTNIRTGDLERIKVGLMLWSIAMGCCFLFALPAAISVAGEAQALAKLKAQDNYPETLACPRCGQSTESLKQLRLPLVVLFLVVVWSVSMDTVTACPPCLRRTLRWRFFGNLLPGNLVALFMGPGLLFHYLRSYQHGHAPAAVERSLAMQRNEPEE